MLACMIILMARLNILAKVVTCAYFLLISLHEYMYLLAAHAVF